MTAAFIGIDWGTTHRRAVLLSHAGEVLAEHADAEGALACTGRFRPALESLLALWPEAGPNALVVMAGMVGSATGWQPVPYLGPETPLGALAGALVPVAEAPAGRRWFIVPGYSVRDDEAGGEGDVDVMRGEETQLFGAMRLLDAGAPQGESPSDGRYVLPGTHSKWVRLHAGRIVELRTYMTGELFSHLRERGTLAGVMHGTRRAVEPHDPGFARGVGAMRGEPVPVLSHALFGARARVVTGDLAADAAAAYVSGLLIGAEWADAQRRASSQEPVRVIGEPALAALHAACAAGFDRPVRMLDVRAVQLAAWRALASEGAGT